MAQYVGGVMRCNPGGGAPEQLAKVDDDETVLGPQMLPGGDGLLFTIAKVAPGAGTRWDQARVVNSRYGPASARRSSKEAATRDSLVPVI